MRRRIALCLTIGTAALMAACNGDDGPAPPPPDVRHWISRVELTAVGVGEEPVPLADTVQAVFNPGRIPPESQGPPLFVPATYPTVETGEGFVYDFGTYARDNLTKFYVWVGEGTGFWEITLPESAGSIAYGVGLKVTVTFDGDAPLGPFHLRAAGTDTLGKTGVTANQRIVLAQADTGIQVPDILTVLTWTGGSDLDLHVIDPFGHDLSPFIPTTPEGGLLEGDASGACVSDTTSHETALWPKGKAPVGDYRVVVVYYADCGATAPVSYSVSLKARGSEERELTGTLQGPAAGSAPDTAGTFTIR